MFDRRPPGREGPDQTPERAREEDPAQLYLRAELARRQHEAFRRREAERRQAEEADRIRLASLAPEERERVLAERESKRPRETEAREAERAAAREEYEAAQSARREAPDRGAGQREASEKELQARREEHQRQREAKETAEHEAEAKRKAKAEAAQLARDREELARYERDHYQEPSDSARQRLAGSPADADRLAAANARADERHAAEFAELRAAQEANRQAGQHLRANVRAAVVAALPRLEPLREARRAGKLHEDALVTITRDIFAAVAEVIAACTQDRALAHQLRVACSSSVCTLDGLDGMLDELPARVERVVAKAAADARAPLIPEQLAPAALVARIKQASGDTLNKHACSYAQEKAEAEAPAKLDEACAAIASQLHKVLRARGVAEPETWLAQARARWFDERGAIRPEVLAENERARGALRVFIAEPRTPWHMYRGAVVEGFTLIVERDLAGRPQAEQAQGHAQQNLAAEADREERPRAAEDNVSRHAAAPAPPDWSARVVASMPSEIVVADDPGNRYHVLDDGMAIAASDPRTLKPEVAAKVTHSAKQPVQAPKPKTPDAAAASGELLTHDAHAGKRAIDAQPDAAASSSGWIHYLSDLHRFLRDQTGAEKEALLDIRRHREEHPIVGAVAETFASVRAGFHSVKVPDERIWDPVFASLEKAHALLGGEVPDLDAARHELATAVKLFRGAHEKTYEYRSRTEGGAEAAVTALRAIEIGCDITLAILSAGLGGGAVNIAKLGARGVFKLVASQAAESGLVKTALKAVTVGGVNKLAQSGAEEAQGYAVDLNSDFDVGKVVREAGEAAVLNLLGVLVGGALNKVFMRTVGEIIGSRMTPEALLALTERYGVQGAIPPELFVSKGWRFLVGVAGDACTTTLLTALSISVEHLRTGGEHPTGEQFVALVVEQMIRNGLLQVVLGAVTHERAKRAATSANVPAKEPIGSAPERDSAATATTPAPAPVLVHEAKGRESGSTRSDEHARDEASVPGKRAPETGAAHETATVKVATPHPAAGITGGKSTLEDFAGGPVPPEAKAQAKEGGLRDNKMSLADHAKEIKDGTARTEKEMLAAIAQGDVPRYIARVDRAANFTEHKSFGRSDREFIFGGDPADLRGLSPARAMEKVGWTKEWMQKLVGQEIGICVFDTQAPVKTPAGEHTPSVSKMEWPQIAEKALSDQIFMERARAEGGISHADLAKVLGILQTTPVRAEPNTADPMLAVKAKTVRRLLKEQYSASELYTGMGATLTGSAELGAREVMVENNETRFRLTPDNHVIVKIGTLTQADVDALH